MGTAYPSKSERKISLIWPLFAGIYMFLWGIEIALLLSDFLTILAEAIGISTQYWMVIFASPVFAIGGIVWWAAIERRDSYTYSIAVTFGTITALITGLLWIVQFVRYWGLELAVTPIISFLIAIVIGIAAIGGALAAIPLMYARRRLNGELKDRKAAL